MSALPNPVMEANDCHYSPSAAFESYPDNARMQG